MSNTIQIDGKKFQHISEVAVSTSYSRDYVTRLAREKKISAAYVGRNWFVDIESLKEYTQSVEKVQQLRKVQLSQERKLERRLKELVVAKSLRSEQRVKTLHVRSVITATLVLCFGIAAGLVGFELSSLPQATTTDSLQLANLLDTKTPDQDKNNYLADEYHQVVVESAIDEARVVQPIFRKELHPMGNTNGGVLLLPNVPFSNQVVTAEDMFSDVVEVFTAVDGSQKVWRVDASGVRVGEPIPFVVVPVTRE